jgi:hypothetical protein
MSEQPGGDRPEPDPGVEDLEGTDPGGTDDGGPYGVYGEGRPRRIVGDSDEPPRRRPRTRPAPPPADGQDGG